MTNRQLTGFLTIVEKESFTAAADALYISQSALSQQIHQLEHEIGFSLFDRGTRKVTLTEAGRSFHQTALKAQALFVQGIAEGQQLQQMHQQKRQSFCIGCLNDQFLQIWTELTRIAKPISRRYALRPVRYESKEALYAALLRGEAHLAALFENEDLERFGLDFLPFARVPELCLFTSYSMDDSDSIKFAKPCLQLEDLDEYLLAFHNHPGSCFYEDRLRRYLHLDISPNKYIDPKDFFTYTSSYKKVLLLVPATQYSGHALALPLDWDGGATLGFVTAPHADPKVLEYARYIKEHLQPIPDYWEPIRD